MSFDIRLLYVDDNPLDRALVRDALAHDPVSFHLTEAASREEFEALLAPGRYDLVLSDFNILGFQGLQVLAAVKAVDPKIPVVIVTGTGSEEVAVEAMKRGAADYVIKDPRHIQRLPQTLRAILDQARQRQATAEATARYRELFRSVPVALYRFTLDGEVFFANPAFQQALGLLEGDQALPRPLAELFVSPAAQAEWLNRLEREGLVRGFEAQFRRCDGALIWVRLHARAVRDEHFQVMYCEGSLEDITERKQAEAALRESEARFRTLVDSMDDIVFTLDREGRHTGVFGRWAAAAGLTPEAFLGRTAEEVLGPEAGSLHTQANRQALAGQRVVYEWSAGEQVTQTSLSPIYDEAGQVAGLVGVGRDITLLKQAEAALRDQAGLLESISDAVISTDAHFNILSWNPAAEAIYGWTAAEVVGRPIGLILDLEQDSDNLRERQKALRSAGVWRGEIAQRRKDGARLQVMSSITALRDGEGRLIGAVAVNRDITTTKRAQAEQQAQQARYELALEGADLGTWDWDLDSGRVVFNRRWCEMLGYTPAEIAPHVSSWQALIHPDDRPAVETVLQAHLAGHTPAYEAEHRLRHKSGGWVWVLDRGRVLERDSAGRPTRMCGTHLDITERRQAETALRASEARYRSLVEAQADIVMRADQRLRVTFVNQAFCRTFGVEPAQVLGQSVLGQVAPEDHPIVLARLAALNQPPYQNTGENRDLTLAGERWFAWVNTAIRDEAGQVVEYQMVGRDITERRQTEAELRLQSAALAASANAIVITDPQGTIQWVNPAYTALTGYSAEEVRGQTPRLLKSGRHTPAFYRNLWETILAGQVWRGELVNRRRDGRLYEEEQVITPVKDPAGQIIHFVAVKQDITPRKQRERELESIAQVSAALRAAAGRAEMPPIILDQVAQLLQVRGAALALRDEAGARTGRHLGQGEWVDFTGQRLPPDEAVMQHVLETGRPYVCDDVRADARFYQQRPIADPYAAACVPLITHQTAIGVLWAARDWPFLEAEVRVLASIADIAASALHRAALHEQTMQRLSQLQALHIVDQAITSSLDARLTLGVLLDQLTAQLAVHAADILALNPHQQTLEYLAGRGFTGRPFTAPLTLAEGGWPAQAALERRTVQVPDLAAQLPVGQRGAALAGERFAAYLAFPLIVQGQVKGVLELFHRAPYRAEAERLELLEIFAGQAAIALENTDLFLSLQRSNTELRQAYDATIEGWSRALDMRDKETEGHTRRVTELTLRLARAMGLGDDELVHIRRGALLHDIGKMGVPDDILLKPGPLTEAEWAVMRQHPQYAREMLEPIAFLRPALDIPYCHHEKWDGTGYPRGLAGEAIPLAARLFAVVDVWDALGSDRPYRPAWPPERVREHLRAEAGRHFDPRVVEAFLKLVPRPPG